MRTWLRRYLPAPHTVREHKMLRLFGPSLHHPRLWHLSRHGIALGVAIGVFFGLLIPIAQMPASAVFAMLLRANLPAAIASTLVTNPFTFAPVYYLAYQIGAVILGEPTVPPLSEAALASEAAGLAGWLGSWSERLAEMGKPLLLGLAILAVTMSLSSYFLIDWAWRARTLWAWRRRSRGRSRTPD